MLGTRLRRLALYNGSDEMSWVYAMAKASISPSGDISLRLDDVELRPGRRPIEPTEGFSPNLEALEAIRDRRAGRWQSPVFVGGATAVLASFCHLDTLSREALDRLWQKYGPWYDEVVLAAVRNTMAPAIWNVAEPFGGSAEVEDLELARVLELAELGLYRRGLSGPEWPSFKLLSGSTEVNEEQRMVWRALCKDAREVGEVSITGVKYGSDSIADQPCIVSAGPGDLSIVRFARLAPPPLSSDGWCIRDGELDRAGQPLNRKMVVIARRPDGKSPIMFEFAPEGGLDPCGLHMALSGEALEYNLSHLTRDVLGTHGLGWLKGA